MDDVTKYGPVDGDPISTEEIPCEFDPNLAPGTEKVVQKVNQELKQQQQLMSILIQEKKLAKVNQQKNNKTTSG